MKIILSNQFLKWIIFSALALLTGCANQYKQFYRPLNSDVLEKTYLNRESAPLQNPIVERASPSEAPNIVDKLAKRGYGFIGHSTFNSGRQENINSAIELAKEVKADLVVVMDPQFTGSQTSVVPITTPTTSTSFSSGTATAYGSRGMVTAYGTGTTTTYGSVTNMVPVTINRMDYSAAYFVKMKIRFGAIFRDLNDIERQRLQTNKGSVVRLVVDGSPAFKEDLLVGDIILAVNGVPVESSSALVNTLSNLGGQVLNLRINRNDNVIEKTIQRGN